MDLEKEFESFHSKIKIGIYDEEKDLRDKRDLLIKDLREKLKNEKIPNTNDKLTFTKIDQGSYAMNTGIKPIDSEYDIDIGIIFNINNEDYESEKLKKLVRDKLNSQYNRTVEYNRPCITVKYSEGYHVDLAIYSKNNDEIHIAWGKEHSESKLWYASEPKKLTKWISDVSSDSDKSQQYRRCVRFLKKWKEKNFKNIGNEMPPSIGITVQARNHFIYYENNYLAALINIVSSMKYDFICSLDSQNNKKISVNLPVKPYKNIYYKMSNNQMNNYYNKVVKLLDALEAARDEDSRKTACKILIKVFGDTFPLSDDESKNNEKSVASVIPPVVTTGQSG